MKLKRKYVQFYINIFNKKNFSLNNNESLLRRLNNYKKRCVWYFILLIGYNK